MLESNTRCWAEIELSKIKHNVDEIHKMIPKKTKIMGIIKANGYGHGDVAIGKALQACGVDFFGVSSIDEALQLRQAGITATILVLGYTPPIHFHYLHEYDIIQTLISYTYARKIETYAAQMNVMIAAHVKVDTGMSRLGEQCKEEVWDIENVKAMYKLPHIHVQGIFSHFSVSDSLDSQVDIDYTRQQIVLYDRVLSQLREAGIHPGLTHLQNSYGILNHPELAYDYVRPGLLYLGVTSNDAVNTKQIANFKPIMTWLCNVSYVKMIAPGSSVSYGCNFKASKLTKVATISCGYADGYPRSISNKGKEVLIRGQRARIIGNVCMDQMMVDITHIEDVKEGDRVVLFGYDGSTLLSVDELSRFCETINNDTFCRISARVPRIYHK